MSVSTSRAGTPAVGLAPQGRRETELDRAVAACWSVAWALGLFSLAINLLMLTAPLYMLQVYDRVIPAAGIDTLVMLTALAGAAMLLFGLLDALRSAVTMRMGAWLADRLGPVYLANSVRLRLLGESSGAQPLRDLQVVQTFTASHGLTVLLDAPWSPVFVALLWVMHPAFGALAAASAVLLLALGLANEYVTRSAAKATSQAQIAAMQQAEATIRNAEVVRSMGMLPAMVARWRDSVDAAATVSRRANERGALLLGLTKSARLFVQSATLGLGAYLVIRGEVSGGAMIAASVLLSRALAPIEVAMGVWKNFGMARLAYGRLQAHLRALPPEPVRMRLRPPAGIVTFDRVTYAPPGSRTPVLAQVSFKAWPGEAVAVIGPSGGGKSTLCRILVGIAEPASGQVRLDGSEFRHWDPEQLGRYVGYLPQDVELFAGTVRENIARMGEADDEAVMDAAMLAHAHEVIQRLPQGYDTQVGEGGTRLSGGQRQRIGLARAVYGRPRLLVLDEPNANLDQAGEAALAAAIEEVKRGGATVVIVGHRPSTIAQADKILLLREGRVEQFGPREEVLKRLKMAQANRRASADAGDEAQQRA